MHWAGACTGFFGLLRAGEFIIPSQQAYDPGVHLNLADLAIDSHEYPTVIYLLIKQSKTDPFWEGVEIVLGATLKNICPIKAILTYLSVQQPNPGPLFQFQSGTPLTQEALVANFQKALQQAGLNHKQYKSHSFGIGAATSAAQRGLEDSLIQTLGCWRSDAYKIYIKLPCYQLATISQTLSS